MPEVVPFEGRGGWIQDAWHGGRGILRSIYTPQILAGGHKIIPGLLGLRDRGRTGVGTILYVARAYVEVHAVLPTVFSMEGRDLTQVVLNSGRTLYGEGIKLLVVSQARQGGGERSIRTLIASLKKQFFIAVAKSSVRRSLYLTPA